MACRKLHVNNNRVFFYAPIHPILSYCSAWKNQLVAELFAVMFPRWKAGKFLNVPNFSALSPRRPSNPSGKGGEPDGYSLDPTCQIELSH